MDWGGWEMNELLNKAKILFNKRIVSVALRAEVGESGGLVCVAVWVVSVGSRLSVTLGKHSASLGY